MIPQVNNEKEPAGNIYLKYKEKITTWFKKVWLNKLGTLIIALILTAIVLPLLLYQYVFVTEFHNPPYDGLSFGICRIARQRAYKLPCGIGNVTKDQCHKDCCYDYINGFCFHRSPSRFSFLSSYEGPVVPGDPVLKPRIPTIPYKFQKSFPAIRRSLKSVSGTHLQLHFYRSDETKSNSYVDNSKDLSHLKIEHKEVVNGTQGIIFNAGGQPLIASDNIWEMVFKLTNETMYGLGEIPLEGETTKVIYSHKGGLSSIPLIYAKLNGAYHALLIDTVSPTEVNIRKNNRIAIRSITKRGIKFHLFLGPHFANITKDIIKLLQVNYTLDYWMMGTHICSDPALSDLKFFIDSTITEGMPFESHCGNGPAIFNSVCNDTYETLMESVAALRNAGKKFVPHVSPYILHTPKKYNDANGKLCFDNYKYGDYILTDPSTEGLYIGLVNGKKVIYPIYDNIPDEFWKDMWIYGDVDAVVLENNWPLDESNKSDMYDYLPYYSKNFEIAFNTTPKWNATRPGKYLHTHNKYGSNFASAFKKFKSVPIISTSQWMNGDNVINRQNIETSWSSLQKELIEMSLGGISGHRYWSSPVCGDTENFDKVTQAELCAKWYMAATYFPMIKIHSKGVRRDPLTFRGAIKSVMIEALKRRMSLMPYFYTVLQEGPLLRPMFYQFPLSKELEDLTTQFSVGDDLLIVPYLHPNQKKMILVSPPGQWYDAWSGLKIGNESKVMKIPTKNYDILTLIRGGSVLVQQRDVKLTTAKTQKTSAYTLVVALHCETKNTKDIEAETTIIADEQTTTSTTVDKKTDNRAETTNASTTATPTVKLTTTATSTSKCLAQGKFYMSPNLTILFEAGAEALTITAEGDDFSVVCGTETQVLWSANIENVYIYSSDTSYNRTTSISLCSLQQEKVVVISLK